MFYLLLNSGPLLMLFMLENEMESKMLRMKIREQEQVVSFVGIFGSENILQGRA